MPLAFDTQLPYAGSVSPRSSYYQITGLASNTDYVINLSDITNSVSLRVYSNAEFSWPVECDDWGAGDSETRCMATSDGDGNLWLNIGGWNSIAGVTYQISATLYVGQASEGSLSQPLPLAFDTQLPYAGSVSPRNSYYQITGLQSNTDYVINLNDITNSVSLRVYSNAEFSRPVECDAWSAGDSETQCLAKTDGDGNLWLDIEGQNSIAGVTYQISAVLYVGPASEGSLSQPLPLAFDTQLPYAGSVNPRSSYYQITGLQTNTDYVINLNDITDSVWLSVYSHAEFTSSIECSAWGKSGSETRCLAKTDGDGSLWLNIEGRNSIAGVTYQISAALYVGQASEGSSSKPLPLAYDTQLPYAGSASLGSSYYQITGLQSNADYFINLNDLTDSVRLSVYSNAEFYWPAECLSWSESVSTTSCMATSDENGNLWIKIGGQDSIAGVTYQIGVTQ